MNPRTAATPRAAARPPAGRAQAPKSGSGVTTGKGPPSLPPRRVWLWFAAALILNFFVARFFLPDPEAPLVVPYTLFKEEVTKHNVAGDLQPWRLVDGPLRSAGHLSGRGFRGAAAKRSLRRHRCPRAPPAADRRARPPTS